ncbi:MAG: carboxypeptidase-like regulatory domain-containing protein [Candidatus Limnocylindrales bacterium]
MNIPKAGSVALLSAAALIIATAGDAGPATAGTPTATVLTVDSPTSVLFSRRFEIDVALRDAAGGAIANAVLELDIDGSVEARTRTDAAGAATFSVSRDLPTGSHVLRVRYAGGGNYLAAAVQRSILVEPPIINLRTLPPIANAVFEFRGEQVTTGPDGSVRLTLDGLPGDDERPTFVSAPQAANQRMEFDKWFGKAPDLTASFNVFYYVSLNFRHRLGEVVDPATITRLTIRSSIGEVIELDAVAPMWVFGQRVVSLAGGLEVKDILYGIDLVEIEGTNVVNRAEQRFVPRETTEWDIEVLFYRTKIALRDLFFSFPVAARVQLEYPNGRVVHVDADANGTIDLPPLPRGTYKVTPEGVGIKVTRPVTMSRDASVELTVITYLDMAVAVAVPLAIAIVLLLLGRPHLVRLVRPSSWPLPGRRVVRRFAHAHRDSEAPPEAGDG